MINKYRQDKTRQDSLFKPEGQSPYDQKYISIYMQ